MGKNLRTPRRLTYISWHAMKTRCSIASGVGYRDYGSKGIWVCERWRNSFENFLEDMGERPSPAHSLDRIDNSSNYSPENCRWATLHTQSRNRSDNVWVEFQGKKLILEDVAKLVGLKTTTLWMRINKYGWSLEKALNTPVKG